MLNNQIREDLLITALEGGSNYWYFLDDTACQTINKYCTKDEPLSECMWKAIEVNEEIKIRDTETFEVLGYIDMASIERGEQTMLEHHKEHYANAISENWDAETADVWFQLTVMNELRFG